jgi:FKBP-type peptidyl-prolyl cis-trans isomerase (trigger factor)
MKWEQSHNSDAYHRLQIEADWAELSADYDDIMAGFAKRRLPGFRPEKVPLTVIEQRFRKEIINDLSQRAAQRLGREAVREAGAEALGPIEATDIECEKGKTFRFKARYLPMQEITLPDYALLKNGDDSADPLDRLSRRLLDLVQFDVPDEIVKTELALDGTGDSDPSSVEWEAAAERIRLMLILKKIARTEGIEVDETDVERRIGEKAVEFGAKPEILKTELENGGGMQRLRDMLLAESTLGYLIEKTGVTRRVKRGE